MNGGQRGSGGARGSVHEREGGDRVSEGGGEKGKEGSEG